MSATATGEPIISDDGDTVTWNGYIAFNIPSTDWNVTYSPRLQAVPGYVPGCDTRPPPRGAGGRWFIHSIQGLLDRGVFADVDIHLGGA